MEPLSPAAKTSHRPVIRRCYVKAKSSKSSQGKGVKAAPAKAVGARRVG